MDDDNDFFKFLYEIYKLLKLPFLTTNNSYPCCKFLVLLKVPSSFSGVGFLYDDWPNSQGVTLHVGATVPYTPIPGDYSTAVGGKNFGW